MVDRIEEYKSALTSGYLKTISAVAEHAMEENHSIAMEETKILTVIKTIVVVVH